MPALPKRLYEMHVRAVVAYFEITSNEEVAFYDTMKANDSTVQILGDDTIRHRARARRCRPHRYN